MNKHNKTATIPFRTTKGFKLELGQAARREGYSGVSALVREAVERRNLATTKLPLDDRQRIQELSLDLQRFIGIMRKAILCEVAETSTSADELTTRIVRPLQSLVRRLEKLTR